MHRISFIEQMLPLFTRIEKLSDKEFILNKLCDIHFNSIDHALDPLSIFNTFKPENFKDSIFIQQFEDLVHGLYPFTPCIGTREHYYLLRPFILHLISPAILSTDPLKPFESTILSNESSFDHFHGYMNILLPLMKKENLTASVLWVNETDIRRTLCHLNYWSIIISAREERTRMFYLCLKDISCVLLLLNVPLTNEQFETIIIQRLLAEK
jgi:hypothetical protein